MQSQKPDPKFIDPVEENAYKQAKRTIGDYKLKLSLNLGEDSEDRHCVNFKRKQIIESRRRVSSYL